VGCGVLAHSFQKAANYPTFISDGKNFETADNHPTFFSDGRYPYDVHFRRPLTIQHCFQKAANYPTFISDRNNFQTADNHPRAIIHTRVHISKFEPCSFL